MEMGSINEEVAKRKKLKLALSNVNEFLCICILLKAEVYLNCFY